MGVERFCRGNMVTDVAVDPAGLFYGIVWDVMHTDELTFRNRSRLPHFRLPLPSSPLSGSAASSAAGRAPGRPPIARHLTSRHGEPMGQLAKANTSQQPT